MNNVKVESDVTRLQLDSEYCICMNISFQLFQGNSEFIASHGDQDARFNSLLSDCTEVQPTACNKDTGSKQRMQKWSRGHLFIVRGGGIIDKWNPLFR